MEVIVLPAGKEENIFKYMDRVTQSKKIPSMSLKEIEKIVHEVRGVK